MAWRPALELGPRKFALFYSFKWDKVFIGMMGSTKEFVWDKGYPMKIKDHKLVWQELPEKPQIDIFVKE